MAGKVEPVQVVGGGRQLVIVVEALLIRTGRCLSDRCISVLRNILPTDDVSIRFCRLPPRERCRYDDECGIYAKSRAIV